MSEFEYAGTPNKAAITIVKEDVRPISYWPPILRDAERTAFEIGLRAQGIANQKTLDQDLRCFAKYLRFAEQNRWSRMPTAESVAAFKVDLLTRCKPLSAATILKRVRHVCQICWRDRDWTWFFRDSNDMWNAACGPSASRAKENPRRPERLRLPFEEWPDDMQQACHAARTPKRTSYSDRYGKGRRIALGEDSNDKRPDQWADSTWDSLIIDVGHFLGFQQRAGLAREVTPECIDLFVDDMDKRGVGTLTSAHRLERIYAAMTKIFAPDQKWLWLREDCTVLRRVATPTRDKSKRIVHLCLAWYAARELMERSEQRPWHPHAASDYEAGMMLGILVFHGLRRANLAEMEIDVHLTRDANQIPQLLIFEHTKTGFKQWRFAKVLLPYWARYWNHFRNLLPFSAGSTAVWPSVGGQPVTGRGLLDHVAKATASTFIGDPLYVHLFRDVMATGMNDYGCPEAARQLLGQNDLATTKTYIQASYPDIAPELIQRLYKRFPELRS